MRVDGNEPVFGRIQPAAIARKPFRTVARPHRHGLGRHQAEFGRHRSNLEHTPKCPRTQANNGRHEPKLARTQTKEGPAQMWLTPARFCPRPAQTWSKASQNWPERAGSRRHEPDTSPNLVETGPARPARIRPKPPRRWLEPAERDRPELDRTGRSMSETSSGSKSARCLVSADIPPDFIEAGPN